MNQGSTHLWEARPPVAARGITIAYCVIVLFPLGLMMIGGTFWLMSYRPVHPGFAAAALFSAALGLGMIVLIIPAFQAVSNQRIVLDETALYLVNAQRKRVREIPVNRISGVWTGELPRNRPASDVPTFPRRFYLVAGGAGDRPISLVREYGTKELNTLWQLLGRQPIDLGLVDEDELNKRFPGSKQTMKDLWIDLGIWGRVYLYAVGLAAVYILVVWLLSL